MVRAKFRVTGIQASTVWRDKGGPDGKAFSEPALAVSLMVVGSGRDMPNEEDRIFGDATPSGQIQITIANKTASQLFIEQLGNEVYVDFTPCR